MVKTMEDNLGFTQSKIELHADRIVEITNLAISVVIFVGRFLLRRRRI